MADETITWVHRALDKTRIPDLPHNKRVQLAAASWHVAIDHQMAVTVLVHETLHTSALALMRPLIEAFLRGFWLQYAATDEEVDRAGTDDFPNDFFGKIVADLERSDRIPTGTFSFLKGETWKALCSYTHAGYMQLGAHLTQDGLGYEYDEAEILGVLDMANLISLICTVEFAGLAGNDSLRSDTMHRIRTL